MAARGRRDRREVLDRVQWRPKPMVGDSTGRVSVYRWGGLGLQVGGRSTGEGGLQVGGVSVYRWGGGGGGDLQVDELVHQHHGAVQAGLRAATVTTGMSS